MRIGTIVRSIGILVLIAMLGAFISTAHGADWRFCYPQPHGNTLHAVWAAGPEELFVGGDGGVIMHWNGSDWTVMDTPTDKVIYSIDGVSSTDVWAVGGDDWTLDQENRSVVLHYNGNSWTEVAPPKFSGWTHPLGGLTAIGADDVWVTNTGGPSLVHWDGTGWEFELLSVSVEGQFLNTFALGENHLFAVGSHGQIVHRYDNEWHLEIKTETGTFTTNLLNSMWGTELDNLYAFGKGENVLKRQPDGTWDEIEDFTSLNQGFVAGTGTDATKVIGIHSNSLSIYNGNETVSEPDFTGRIRGYFKNGAATTDGVFLTGIQGGVFKYYYATDTREAYISSLTAGGCPINNYNTKATACGQDGILLSSWTQAGYHPLSFFDGTVPQQFPVVPDGMEQVINVSAVATSVDDITMSWNTWSATGGIEHWDGAQWNPVSSQIRRFSKIWQSPEGTLFGHFSNGVERLESDRTWTTLLDYNDIPEQVSIKCLWGRNDNDIYLGLTNGQVMHYNGLQWETEMTGTNESIWAIGGDATSIYAVGTKSSAVYKQGANWKSVSGIEQRDEDYFTAVVPAHGGVYASMTTGNYRGRLYKFTNGQATIEYDHYSDPVQAMAKTDAGDVYLVLSSGNIMTSAEKPANRYSGYIDTDSSQWQELGNTGLSIRSTEGLGKQYISAWRRDSSPSLFMPTPAVPAGQQWIAMQDQPRLGPAFGNCYVKVGYNSSLLPDGTEPESLSLYRNDSKGWQAISSLLDSNAGTFQTTTGSGLSVWTISKSQDQTGVLTPMELVGLIYSIKNGTADYRDVFQRSLNWMETE